jgi:hypothetical protein
MLKRFGLFTLVFLLACFFCLPERLRAAQPGSVLMNELAWMGTPISASNELSVTQKVWSTYLASQFQVELIGERKIITLGQTQKQRKFPQKSLKEYLV